jgi:hypothetical protein
MTVISAIRNLQRIICCLSAGGEERNVYAIQGAAYGFSNTENIFA